MKTASALLLLVAAATTGAEAFVLGRPLATVPPTPLLARQGPRTKGAAFW